MEPVVFWVLLLLAQTSKGVTAVNQEFSTKDKCEVAGSLLSEKAAAQDRWYVSTAWVCVPK